MAELISQGYIIARFDYQIYDEIIVILDKNGNKINCLSKGSRKILSKNGRNMFLGSYCEYQYFSSRLENKLNRLKKINIIDDKYILMNNKAFDFLCYLIYKSEYTYAEYVNYFIECVNLIKLNTIPNNILLSIIGFKLLELNGINYMVDECIYCGRKTNLVFPSLDKYGLVCDKCIKKSNKHNYCLSNAITVLAKNQYEKKLSILKACTIDLLSFVIKIINQTMFIKINPKFYIENI